MKQYIDNFITDIFIDKDIIDDTTTWSFVGDGVGDFEQESDCALETPLLEYIEHCEEQIYFAKEYLRLYIYSK
jgi:hypothetical protein